MADAGNLQQLLHGAGRPYPEALRWKTRYRPGRPAPARCGSEVPSARPEAARPSGTQLLFSAFSARRASYAARAQAPVRRKTAQPLPAPSCRSRRGRDQSPDIPRAPAARSILESARPAARTSVRRSAANQAPAPARVPNGPRAAFGLESTRQRSSRAGSAPAQRRTESSAPRA